MPWRSLPRIAFAVATFPFQPSSPADLPLELGDELYIIEEGGKDDLWYRGYLVAPPSLLAGLTSRKGQTLEARVFSGIFPRSCVEVREELGEVEVSHKLANGHPDGGAAADALEADHEVVTAQPRGAATKRPHLTTHDSLKGLGLVTQQRQPQSRDLTPTGENGLGYGSSSFLYPKSRTSTVPFLPTTLDARDPAPAKPPAPVPMLKIGDETPTSVAEPLVDEIASCLREWHSTNLHELLLNRQYATLEKMAAIVSQLDLTRRQLLHDVLTGQERVALREQAVWDLVTGNKMLSGEVIVRDPGQRGRLLTGEDSAIEMTKLQAVMSLLDAGPVAQPESLALHHLLLEIKHVTGPDRGAMALTAALYLKTDEGEFAPLSETFVVDVAAAEDLAKLVRRSKLKTLYTDLSASDVGDPAAATKGELYLVFRLQTADKPKTAPVAADAPALTRNGTVTHKTGPPPPGPPHDLLRGSRRSMRFGSIRKPNSDRRHPAPPPLGGRLTPQEEEAGAPTPISRDGSVLETAKPKVADVVRTVGVGLLDVRAVMRQGKDVEHSVVMWSPAATEEEADDDDEQTFHPAVAKLLRSPTGRYTKARRAARLDVHLAPFTAPDAQSLVRTNPTTMHLITQTPKLGFSEAPTKTRSDIYITLCEAVLSRAALLSHPESGSIQLTTPAPFRNLQLTMEVRDSAGRRMENAIYPSSNSTGHTAWRTVVVEQGERWNQTICVKIPPDQVAGSHLIMSIADAPAFPFGLVWMPLWDQQAFLHDGRHALLMHAYDRTTSSVTGGRGAYLALPWQATGKDFAAQIGDASGHMATVVVESYLCSTEHSQDQVIIGLINWRQQAAGPLLDLLRKIVFVPEIEIVKQRRDVFDALFALLVHKAGDAQFEDVLFGDLVTVLGIVHDRRFNLGPLVDQYAEQHFDFPAAAAPLMRTYTRLLRNAADAQQSRSLRASFKVGRYLMKFIITARQQQKAQADGLGTRPTPFHDEIQAIFRSLERLMHNGSPALVGSKTLLVQHFHSWLPELLAICSADEVRRIATRFMDACDGVTGKLVLYRILLMLNYVQMEDLWRAPAARHTLMVHCRRWLAPYWGTTPTGAAVTEQWREQVRLCASVVAEFVAPPTTAAGAAAAAALYDFLPKIVTSYCSLAAPGGAAEKATVTPLFAKTYPALARPTTTKDRFDEALVELAALMAAIAQGAPPPPTAPVPADELPAFILATLTAQRSILAGGAYPARWLSLAIYHHRASVAVLSYVATLLTQACLPPPDFAEDFDMDLWKTFFTTLLTVVGSDLLALETFPEQKRRAVWKIAGDVRATGAALLRHAWDTIGWETGPDDLRRYGLQRLGGYQVQYVPSLVAPMVELCLSVHEGVRRVAVEVVKTMIISEWALSEDLGPIETEMITSLDGIFQRRRLTESVTQKLFIGELLEMFGHIARQPDDALWVALKDLLGTVDELLELLIAAHGESVEASLHTLRLMDFMKDLQKDDLYVRYVHDLARAQEAAKNSTEAGLALQLHADLYPWNPRRRLPALAGPVFPAQSAFERKEALYFQMIQHFENGRAWALALAAYTKLADLYEHVTFDFAKLARTQRAMAHINEAIAKHPKPSPRYFRVAYRGLGFPPAVRDKQYIFEEAPAERLASFTDRLQKRHPAAQVTPGPADGDDDDDREGQFIQVASVSPHRDFTHPVNARARLPASVRDHLLAASPVQFATTVKRHTVGPDPRTHWVEKVVYTTAEAFPNLLRQSEIVAAEDMRLAPLPTALERTWRKTADLHLLAKRATAGEDPNHATLTASLLLLLDGDGASGHCLAHYRQLLPAPADGGRPDLDGGDDPDLDAAAAAAEESSADEGQRPANPVEAALRVALSDHAAAIKHCLTLYARPSLQATRDDLARRYDAIYAPATRPATPAAREPERESPADSPSGDEDGPPPVAVAPPDRSPSEPAPTPAPAPAPAPPSPVVNGRVGSPELSESDQTSRQSRSQPRSLQPPRGAALALLPGLTEPDHPNTVSDRPNTVSDRPNTVSTRTTTAAPAGAPPPESAPRRGHANGVIVRQLSWDTIESDAGEGPSTYHLGQKGESSKAARYPAYDAPAVTRSIVVGAPPPLPAPGPAGGALPALALPPSTDAWGRVLKDSSDAADSSPARVDPPSEDDYRPATAGSGTTAGEGRKVAKKRFSLVRLGMKRSGNNLSTRRDLEGVEEQ